MAPRWEMNPAEPITIPAKPATVVAIGPIPPGVIRITPPISMQYAHAKGPMFLIMQVASGLWRRD
jgi:hypothetical protein